MQIKTTMSYQLTQVRMLLSKRHVHASHWVNLWPIAHQAPLSMGIPQARILEGGGLSKRQKTAIVDKNVEKRQPSRSVEK